MVIRAAEAAESFHSFPTDRDWDCSVTKQPLSVLVTGYRRAGSGEAENVQLSDMSCQSEDISCIF